MFCGFCGTNLPDDAEFCGNCGRAVIGRPEPSENIIESEAGAVEAEAAQINVAAEAVSDVTEGLANVSEEVAEALAEVTDASAEVADATAEVTGTPEEYSTPTEDNSGMTVEYSDSAEGYTDTPVDYSGSAEGYSGAPADYSNTPEGYSGTPDGYSNVPAAYSNVPAAYPNAPMAYSNVPAEYASAPVEVYAANGMPVAVKKKNKFIIPIVIIVLVLAAVAVGAIFIGKAVSTNKMIGELEDAIFSLSTTGNYDEDQVLKLYEQYDSLSADQKRKVTNRDTIITAYKKIESLVEQRKQAAKSVDAVIKKIDRSNMFAQASTVKTAMSAYSKLDQKAYRYLELEDELKTAYNEVKGMNLKVTADNFYQLFAIEYAVGERTNYGGTTITQSGYTIDWNRYGGSVTPNYDINAHNDYATPVHVYVASRYPDLTSNCTFHINLHQTYNGLGIIDSDVHEFKLQSANISYDSSKGVVDYLINVENNDASGGLLNAFGFSYDWSDRTHKMNPFNAKRVEITNISGSVRY